MKLPIRVCPSIYIILGKVSPGMGLGERDREMRHYYPGADSWKGTVGCLDKLIN